MRNYSTGKSRTDIINQIVFDIKHNIDTYEKRVKLIDIEIMDDKDVFNLRFQIKCLLGEKFHSYYIGFKKLQSPIIVEVEA